jgi:hypothetical protein
MDLPGSPAVKRSVNVATALASVLALTPVAVNT